VSFEYWEDRFLRAWAQPTESAKDEATDNAGLEALVLALRTGAVALGPTLTGMEMSDLHEADRAYVVEHTVRESLLRNSLATAKIGLDMAPALFIEILSGMPCLRVSFDRMCVVLEKHQSGLTQEIFGYTKLVYMGGDCLFPIERLFGNDADIATLAERAPDPHAGVAWMIDAANQAGGTDNITALMLQIHESDADGSRT